MKKRGILIVLMIFIFNSIYVLADEEAYNKWNYDGDTFTTAGKTFTVQSLSEIQTKIEFENKFLNINNGTCDVSDFIKVCINETKKDANISLGYKSNIKIYKMTANLELTRTIDKISLLIGEEANIEILIKNTGSRDATSINFEDKFPNEIKPKNANGCLIKDHTIFWQGDLWQDNEKRCSYKIEALGKLDYASKAELSYNNGFQTKTLSSKEEKLKIEDYALKIETSQDRNDIGEEFNFNVKLTNINKDYSVNIPYIYFRIPREIEIIEKPINLWQDNNLITFRGDIEPNSIKEFSFRLKGEKAGTYKLKEEVRFLTNRIVNEFEREEDITIEIREPYINHNIKDSYLSNETINFILKVKNPSIKYRFDYPTVKTSGLIESFYKAPKINEDEEFVAIKKDIKLPEVKEDKVMPLNITFTYETIYNQKLKSEISKNVLIKAPKIIENVTKINITEVQVEVKKEEEKVEEKIIKEKKEEKVEIKEINLIETPTWAIIFIIIFLLIDSFLVISILKKMKER